MSKTVSLQTTGELRTRYDYIMMNEAPTWTVFPADPRLAAVRDYDLTFTTLEAAEDCLDELEGRGEGPLAIREN
jgi:hypothetical protein